MSQLFNSRSILKAGVLGFAMASALASTSARAELVQILEIGTEGEDRVAPVKVDVDAQGLLVGLEFKAEGEDPLYFTLQQVSEARLEQNELLLIKKEGREVALLSSDGLDAAQGGLIHLRYLVDGRNDNAEKRKYAVLDIKLASASQGHGWSFYGTAPAGETIELAKLMMKQNVKSVGPFGAFKAPVGVKRITGISTDGTELVLSEQK